MTNSTNSTYYKASRGTLSGFDQVTTPTGNPDIVETGFSIQELMRFLTNQSAVNFPSASQLETIENQITAHEQDYNNPHRTTLSQIVGDIVEYALGSITPGTVPSAPPFYGIDAAASLPFGTIVPATFTATNLYRQMAGGWLRDVSTDVDSYGTDYICGRAGVPLFSTLADVVVPAWATTSSARINTTIAASSIATLSYPFTFYDLKEVPVTDVFGMDFLMVQDLGNTYSFSVFLYPSQYGGSVRFYQPSDNSNYVEFDLTTGETTVMASNMSATAIVYGNGVIRVSVGFTSKVPVADNALRMIHLMPNATSPSRAGQLDRTILTIGRPQATKSGLNAPVIVDSTKTATTTPIVMNLANAGSPTTISNFTVTMAVCLYPMLSTDTVYDPNILTIGALVISRDQTTIRVAVNGSLVFTSDILEGLNAFSLSYSPGKLIFKDLANARQVLAGTYAPINTATASVGCFGGYLHAISLYGQSDTGSLVEYLTNA